MVMNALKVTAHSNRSKKSYQYWRSYSKESSIIPHKDRNGNNKHITIETKQPTFAPRKMNSRRSASTTESYSEDYESLVKYISDSWNSVKKEFDRKQQGGSDDCPVYYQEKEKNPRLSEFVPFDVDKWMELRLYNNVTGSA